MSGGGSSGGDTTTTQKSDPWEGQQPYLKDIFSQAQNLYNSGGLAPNYYPGNTVAAQDEATLSALDLQEQRARNGNAGMNAAQNQLAQTMSGDYLQNNPFANADGNPQLDAMVQRAVGQSNAGVNSGFAGAGRYGSGAQAAAANDAAGNIATQMYGQAYDADQNRALSAWNTERDNQIKSMMFAPQLAAADYQDLSALAEVGTARENYAQQQINSDIARYNYTANQPMAALQNYLGIIQGNYGGSSTGTSTGGGRSNPLGGALGGAAAGASVGSIFPGYGTAIGAGLGGLLGMMQ